MSDSHNKLDELEQKIIDLRFQESMRTIAEYYALKRERYLEKLESMDNEQTRGRSKECKELLELLR